MLEKIYYENEINTNRIAATVIELFAYLLMALGLLGGLGILDQSYVWTYIWMISASIVIHIACSKIRQKYYTRTYTRPLILSMVIITCGSLFALYPLTNIFILFGPILLSVKYYDKKFTVRVSIATFVVFIIACLGNFILHYASPAVAVFHAYQGDSLYDYPASYFCFYVIPKSLLILITAILGLSIADGGKKLVETQAEISSKANAMQSELNAAAVLQEHSLPAKSYTTDDGSINISTFVKPAREVGGDTLDYFVLNDHIAGVMIADVSDKGLSSAMYAIRLKSAFSYAGRVMKDQLNDFSLDDIPLDRIVNTVNKTLCQNNTANYFVTTLLICIDYRSGELAYINAGHEMPIIRHEDGTIEQLRNDPQMVMGLFRKTAYRVNKKKLKPGDSLFIYTDGLTDARNSEDEKYGYDRLMQSLENIEHVENDKLSQAIIDRATDSVTEFVGDVDQFDDITALALTYCGINPKRKLSIKTTADAEGFDEIMKLIENALVDTNCSVDFRRIMCTAVDEILNNIVNYAYQDDQGYIKFSYTIEDENIVMEFRDAGVKFNPLKKQDPDLSKGPQIGGYGIFLVKQIADSVTYRYENEENVLILSKSWK